MSKKLLLGLVFLSFAFQGFSQNAFFAVANGSWNGTNVWSLDGVTPIACGPCVAGTDFPGSNDQAYTQGFNISLPANSSFSVSDLYVAHNVALGITRPNLGLAPTLTIRGELAAYDVSILDYATPTTNIIRNDGSTINLVFDGANAGGPVINSWGSSAPLKSVRFNPASSATTLSIPGVSLSNNGTFTVSNGTLQLDGTLRAATGATVATITINTGTTLRVNTGNINGDGTTGSSFPSIVVNGTLTSAANTTSYINCASITLGAGSTLNVGYNGANQSQGWWFTSNAPTGHSIDPTSTISYNANVAQNISAGVVTYGNLSLASGSVATKTLSGIGLTVQGNLVIGANVTFSPTSQVDFVGSTAQSISGTGTATFTGGIEVNKTASSLTLSKALTVNGFTVTAGTLNLGDIVTSITGSNSNSGTITSGTAGTVQTSGTTSFFGAGTTTVNNLTVSSGTTTFTGSSSITGNLVNSGSLVLSSTSTVTFSGGSAQSISGNAISFGNITVNKTSSTLSNNANIVLTGVLTMTNGTFDADGTGSGVLTLNSDTNGDASIGPMAGGSITGEVTFERYFNNTSNRWRNLAFPVSQVTYAELGAGLTLNSNSLATYTESTLGNVDQGWTVVNGGTLNSARGHSAWMYNLSAVTISVRGPLLQNVPAQSGSPYNFGVTYTDDAGQPATQDGWNLVPNPFASPIDWTNSGWVKTNVNAAAAVWDVESNVYRYSNVDWNGIVAQGQAFWIQTNAASPVMTCTESVKESVSDPVFFRKAAEESRLLINLTSGKDVDKAVIQFNDLATSEFDGAFDAYKLKNGIFNLSTITREGIDLAANVLPKAACNSALKINITNATPGSYVLGFEGIETFAGLNSLTLVDHFKNSSQTIQAGESYKFEITNESESFGSDRFEIAFDFADITTPAIQIESGRLVSNFEEGNQWYFNNEPIAGSTDKVFMPAAKGSYYTVVDNGICLMKSQEIVINEEYSRVFPNPASTLLKVNVHGILPSNIGSGKIYMHSVQGQLIIDEGFGFGDTIKEINVSDVKPGVYILTLVSGKATLEKSKVIIK